MSRSVFSSSNRLSPITLAASLALALVVAGCNNKPKPPGPQSEIQPVPFPSGFGFPVPRNTLDQWVAEQNTNEMFSHAWNIWNGMMQPSDQQDPNGNRNLVVFETWLSDVEVFNLPIPSTSTPSSRNLRPFQTLRQNSHGLPAGGAAEDPEQVIAFIKYDPTAAGFIEQKGYNKAATLNQLQQSWTAQTPILDRNVDQFPNPSIALKPTYWLIKQSGLTSLPVWPGPPSPARQFPPSDWDTCVLVDPTNQRGGSTAQGSCNGTSGSFPVVNLSDFHHQQLTAEEAQAIGELKNTADSLQGAQAGDYAALVAMHVTSKELLRWTWQTFWWSPDPDDPKFPSSAEAAAQRPSSLPRAAAHYATCTAYSMVIPAQPETGGDRSLCPNPNDPSCLLCYNPYLEPGLSEFGTGSRFKWGVESNCMSCHSGAHWPDSARQPGYVGDQYVDLGGPEFADVTKLDFLWSLQNAN